MSFLKDIERAIIRPIGNAVSEVFKWLAGIEDPEAPEGLELSKEGSNIKLPVIYGERLVGGVTVHKWVTNSITGLTGIKSVDRNNAYIHMIVAFCHGEIESFEKFYFNGDESTDEQYDNAFYYELRNGVEGQSAISQAIANIPNWDSNMVGNRVAYGYFCFYQDSDQTIWRGEPQIQAVIKGRKVYDPRSGLTAWSQNNAICALDYLTDNLYGRGLSLSKINIPEMIEKADFCDEGTSSTVTNTTWSYDPKGLLPPTPTTTTSTVANPRYKMNAVIDTSDTLLNNYRRLLQSFRAFPRRSAGMVSLEVETSGTPVMNFDSAEGQINGDIVFVNVGQEDRYNSFTVTFPNELNKYERDEATYPEPDSTIYADWLEEDSGKSLEGSLELNTISDKSSALQTAEIAAKRSRFGGQLSINVDSRAMLLEGGDIISISDASFGWTEKPFRVNTTRALSNNTYDLELVEHENSIYPWSGSTWGEVEGGTWLGNAALPEAPTDLAIAYDSTLATTGTLTWTSVDDSFVRSYDVVIDALGGTETVQVSDDNTRGTRYPIQLLDVGEYNISVYAISTLGYRSPAAVFNFTLTTPVTPTLDITMSDWEAEIKPVLSGAGLGTVFDFDYVDGNGTGYTPTQRAQGYNITFGGLIPDTEYTFFCRSVNAYGESAWVSSTQTTTNEGAQLSSFLDALQEEIDDANNKIDGLGFATLPFSINNIMEEANSIIDLGNNQDRIDEARVTNNNVDAVVFSVADVSETVEGNTVAITGLGAELTDLTNEVSANADLILIAQDDITGNVNAIAALDARVENNEDFASAQLVLNSEYDADLNELFAEAFLGVDVNNRITGINIFGEPDNGNIDFIADKVRFVSPVDFSVKMEWSDADDQLTFNGKIVAIDSTFTGTITGGAVNGAEINGGTVTGATVQTDTSGQRVVISGTEQKFYSATSGLDYVGLDGESISVLGSSGDYVTVKPSDSGIGGIRVASSNPLIESSISIGVNSLNQQIVATDENGDSTVILYMDSALGGLTFGTGIGAGKFTPTADKAQITGDEIELDSGDDGVYIKMNGVSALIVENYSDEQLVPTFGDGVKQHFDGALKTSTVPTGLNVRGTITYSSDPTLKDFTRKLVGSESLDIINNLELWNYYWKDKRVNGSALQTGVNAKQARELLPNSVQGVKDGELTFDYKDAFMHGLSAIKELNNKVEKLENLVNQLLAQK